MEMLSGVILWALASIFTQNALGEQPTINYHIEEELVINSIIGNVFYDAFLNETYNQSEVYFILLNHPENFPIALERYYGEIQTAGRIDRDTLCAEQLECTQTMDVLVQPSFDLIKVSIQIDDLNDNSPVFPKSYHEDQMLESADQGSTIVLPSAMDPDSGVYGVQRYELHPESDMFQLKLRTKVGGSKDVRLVLIGELDRESQALHELQVFAFDGGNPPNVGSMYISIHVQDANDNEPVFDNITYKVTVPENVPLQTTILQVQANDLDSGAYGEVIYRFSESTQSAIGHLFQVINTTGEIYVTGVLDYEQKSVYELSILAQDQGPDSVPTDASVIVYLADINDNTPRITVVALNPRHAQAASLSEDTRVGTFVALIAVEDPDEGENGRFTCFLNESAFQLQKLGINQFTIKTSDKLDHESHSRYDLAFICQDHGIEPQISVKYIEVFVEDINDNAPVFAEEVLDMYIHENNDIGVNLGDVNATDADLGLNAELQYWLELDAGKQFAINSTTGLITAEAMFDRERIHQVVLRVLAVDGGDPQMTGSATVIIHIVDVNDEQPRFYQPAYSFSVFENEPNVTDVGVVTAMDADEAPYNEFVYSVVPQRWEAMKFAVEPQTGKIHTLVSLDREEASVYYLTLVATDIDMAVMSSTATVTIYVNDSNDNSPIIDYPSPTNNTVHVPSNAPVGYTITQVLAYDLDLGVNANLTFELVQGIEQVFQIDPLSGHLELIRELDEVDQETFELRIWVQDQGEPIHYAVADLIVVVNDSIVYNAVQSFGESLFVGHNLIIMITVVCTTAAIVLILVVAIVRTQQDEQEHKYNCRTEALKAQRSSRKNARKYSDAREPLTNNNNIMPKGSCLLERRARRQQKGVSFSLERDDGSHSSANDRDSLRSWSLTVDDRMYQILQSGGCGSAQQNDYTAPPGELDMMEIPWTLSPKELALHQLYQMRREQDADSTYSMDNGSNADSGHGPSEEGEVEQGAQGNQGVVGIHPQNPGRTRDRWQANSSSNHQPEGTSSAYSPPTHSYSNYTAHPLHTFSPISEPECVIHQRGADSSNYVTFQRQLRDHAPVHSQSQLRNSPPREVASPDYQNCWPQTSGDFNCPPCSNVPHYYDRHRGGCNDHPQVY